jgi:MFS transporter, DHA1 family, inner membrane transport protein
LSSKEKLLLLVLAGINFTHIMDFMIMMPLQEYLVPVFGISPKQFSWLVAAYGISAGCCSLTASFFVDRFDRKKVLLIAYSGFIIGTLACAFAPTYQMLMLARVVAGLFGGLIGAQVLSIVSDTFPYERRATAMGALMGAFSLAAIAGVPSGLYLANHFNWHVPFVAIGIMAVLVLVIAFKIIPPVTSHIASASHNPFEIYTLIFKTRNMQMGLLMMFTLIVAHFSIIPFIAPYVEKNVGFTKNDVAAMYFWGGVVSLLSSMVVGRLADKFGKHLVMGVLLVASALPVYLITNIGVTPLWQALFICCLFFALGGGRMIPAQAILSSVVRPQQRGGFMNVAAALQQIGTALTSVVAGTIVTKNEVGLLVNYNWVGYMGIALSVVCLFIMFSVKPIEENK